MAPQLTPFAVTTDNTAHHPRYTALAASEGLLALGATTGGLYCFDLRSRKLLTILQHKEGQVAEVCISPDGKYIAVGTEGGAVVVWEHNFDNLKVKPRRVKSSSEMHKATVITALHWDDESSRVYV